MKKLLFLLPFLFGCALHISGSRATNQTTAAPSTLVPMTSTYLSIRANILDPRCVYCHDSGSAAPLVTYSEVLALVVPGAPDSSLLFQHVSSRFYEDMPKNAAPLSESEQNAIHDWISSGAIQN